MPYKVGQKVAYLYRGMKSDMGTIIKVYHKRNFQDQEEHYTIYWDWCGEKSAEGGFTEKSIVPYYEPNDILKGML